MSGGVHIPPDSDMAERHLDSIGRYRTIARRVAKVRPIYLQDILHIAYAPRSYPPEIEATFSHLAGLAMYTDAARSGFLLDSKRRRVTEQSISIWLIGVILRGETALIRKIKREARAMLDTAHAAYESEA